ncbi:uncharacterized protein LOC114728119 isoform X2 [Neltuma alba]|uniref:uncharacterized protein LOC114728119 isoform X2 n=1 Tax=Neltuma alba TaxID=207710 RepID=UPI0010A477F1|nr:uncharacterized protein LOC114728119 isoform X2 [Prosopis alba]
MEPASLDLLTEAKKLESEVLSTIKLNPAHVSGGLDKLLKDAYAIRCPKPVDYFNRKDLIRIFNIITKEIYGKGIVRGVQTILTARVPIVKVIDCGTGIECDLSVDNRDGIEKSHIIHAISLIDERFQKLSFLMKCWAKSHNINSSKDRTLNSLSIVSLVALHLQTRNPPILPPFSALLKDGSDPAAVKKVVDNYVSFGQKNVESLAELFVTLFVMLASVEKLWEKGLCASLYQGSWIFKSWGSRSYPISVEDFTDRSQNIARAVGTEEVKTIYRCIRESLSHFSDYLNGKMLGTKLVDLLFGGDTPSTTGLVGAGDIDKSMKNLPISENQRPLKRQRFVEDLEVKQIQKPSEGNYFVQGNQRAEPWKGSALAHQAHVLQGGTFQPPAISSSYNRLPHGYGPGTTPASAQNQLGFGGSFNSHQRPKLVPVLNPIGYPGAFHHQAVHPNPSLGPIHSHYPLVSNNLYQGGPSSSHAQKR